MRFLGSVKTVILVIIIGILLYSCNTNNTSGKISRPAITKQSILLSNIKTHIFSDHSNKDTFKLVLTGDSLSSATAFFSIISHKGEMIYADTFPSSYLFDKSDTNPPSIANVESGIKIRAHNFFNKSTFIDTMAPMSHDSGENDDEGIIDTVFMKEIASDNTIIGFQYSIGAAYDQCIAYSKKQQKVLVYWGIAVGDKIHNGN